MKFNELLLTASVVASALAAPLLDRRQFAYGSIPVRGVNIGGWLVLEPFITPSIFAPYNGAAVDEYTLCQNVPGAASILQNHWGTWATEADFQKIHDNGFNLVRIPIGYWAFQKYENDPYIMGAADYLEAAIGWARNHQLKVWIDLHGAPRSQNGFDNSGQRMDSPQWTSGDSVAATNNVIRIISDKYATQAYKDVIVGIELLNEPLMPVLPGGRDATAGFYQDSFNIVRQHDGDTMVVIHDGFATPSSWNGFLTGQGSAGAIIDHHEYQVFSPSDNALSPQGHIDAVWSRIQSWGTGFDKFTICGEWAAAMTDCAPWLNGYGRGARYDNSFPNSFYVGSCQGKSGSVWNWSQDWKSATTNYILAQRQAYEKYLQGWIVWNFKTESADDWSILTLIDAGVWPGM